MRRAILVILFIAVVSFAGCAETTPVKPTTPQLPTIIIDYQRIGGVAGLNDHLVIFGNGEAIVKTKTESTSFSMNQADLDNLISLLEKASFPALEDQYKAQHMGEDYFTYTITYQGKRVLLEDTAVPDTVEPVIVALNDIIAASRKA